MNRTLDVAGASLGLALTSPSLAVAALAIKLDDRGPRVYRQQRVGRDGREFELLKLRTMVAERSAKAPGGRSTAAIRASPVSAGRSVASRSTSCPSSGTSSAVR